MNGLCAWTGAMLFSAAILSPAAAQTRREREQPKVDGRLIVEDRAEMFSPEAVKKAKGILAEVRDTAAREMNVYTFTEIPESKKKEFAKLESSTQKNDFFHAWAKEELIGSRGVVVFVCRSPGHVQVFADKQIRDKGFANRDEEHVLKLFLERFKEAKDKPKEEQAAIRDKALLSAAEFVRDEYKKMAR
jgi:uncharacterized protein